MKLTTANNKTGRVNILFYYLICGTALMFTTCTLNRIHGDYCGIQWERPDTWMHSMVIASSPACRTLNRASTFTQNLSDNYFFGIFF